LEEALDLSFDRLLMMMMMMNVPTNAQLINNIQLAHQITHIHRIVYIKTFKIGPNVSILSVYIKTFKINPTCFDPKCLN